MQEQLDALDSIVTQLVQRADHLHQENDELKKQLSDTQAELASTKDELAKTRGKLEDTGIRIGLLIEQLTRDTNIEPIVEEDASDQTQEQNAAA
ncbi:hypothetical protein MAF45_09420 [Mesosutterella sp. OilRF-GAM-744-9]|uniref:Cell division protein ZapB n=1 Tax=Mesosutterella porci TaxID=2915351 RepID=A0ABS9MSR2_9BURK|nr:hypothetical protein [Mesosutterella sp. oilRF-744-WT-GAM-9]MCG5031656.1 hypothetical protein [Mesosutterella sp. oilRF-744-WT-GAM-9]MCI6530679.1 hypothetical protein [Mesosutterella sp.]